MCAIAGIVGNKLEKIHAMTEIIKHRGPDDSKIEIDQNNKVAISMSRLSIIDLKSEGLCLYENEGLLLSYNGEIYNYKELKSQLLDKGIKFKTHCDTELFLKAYIYWGKDCFAKFDGMFAAAIYDKKKKEIILARDISGEKPLYYYKNNNVFAFASEAKAFLKNFKITKNQNRLFFNAFQHCLNETLWKEVYSLPPATFMVLNITNLSYKIKKYWEFKQRDINLETAEEELENLLKNSITKRTSSDVRYGLYFSGGIDSSLISTFHKFKYKFNFNAKLEWKKEFYDNIKKIAWHLDFPVGSLSSFPLWKLAQTASKKVKVILSGEGADEIFGGYVRYLPVAQEYNLKKQFPSYSSYLFKKYFKFENYLDAYASLTARNKKDFEFIREMLKPYFQRFEDPINAMGYADFELIMPSLLQMGDRMSSAFGLENRCPFLDKKIIEFGFSLPFDYKIRFLHQKNLLRNIASKRGLIKATKMEKKGLIIIYNEWIKKKDWDRSYYFNFLKKNSLFT
jgi:asparagine synthase (glutamine-hydrolysing)